MPFFRNISIKRKLTLIIMAASTVALLLVSAGFVAYELIAFRNAIIRDTATIAEILGNQNTAALIYDESGSARESLEALRAKKPIVSACIYKDGEVFARYAAEPGGAALPDRPRQRGFEFKDDHLILYQPIVFRGETVGVIGLKSDLRERRERLVRYAWIIGAFMLASMVVTYLLSLPLQRIISRPILHLLQTANEVSAEKNYSVRARKHGRDELGELIDGFNEMLTQIQERDAALQRANDQLDKRVQERTQDLQLEIAERKRTEAALQQQVARVSLLNQITQVVSERQDLESILQVVLRQLEERLSVDLGAVCLFDSGANLLNVAALRLKSPRLNAKLELQAGAVLPLEDSGFRLCSQGQTVYLPDTLKVEARLMADLARSGIRSIAAVPLMVENKLFGVLAVARLKLDGFSSGECEFLRTLSEHLALAAHQAQLHSELEKAYNDLRQTQQTIMQQERLKALGQMASGIAHDVNNALSPVVGFADLLMRSEPGLSPTSQRYLQHIKTAGEDIAHIVARLREFYRRRDGVNDTLEAFSLNQLAEQVVEMTRPRWRDIPQGRGLMIEMQTHFDPVMPELVGIQSELREALTNVILNAVDALPNGGRITVRTRTVAWNASGLGDTHSARAILEVIDSGIGMDEATRKHCLEPFFSTKGKRGTGLGLAMVYGVVERHEGTVEIDSELGKGTTVRLTFPVRTVQPSNNTSNPGIAALPPLQILCIDDEPLLRELLREVLQRDGHHVQVSDGGQAGLAAFREANLSGRPFDAVITDLGMPYLDGRQVARMVKHESPATPVILLTGWGAFMKEDGERPQQIDAILSKPPRSKDLREVLVRVTRHAPKRVEEASSI